MRHPLRPPALGLAVLLVLVSLLAACSASSGSSPPDEPRESPRSPWTASSDPADVPAVEPDDPYAGLAAMLHERDVEVWFEADLVAKWLESKAAFDEAVTRLGSLARLPGVAGFKVADELGYGDGLTTPEQTHRFLADSRAALRHVAPDAEVLVDILVPELGCLPGSGGEQDACAQEARDDYPAATADAVTGYLEAGLLDRVDLSTGLLEPSTYDSWGTTIDDAQRQAWEHAMSLGWGDHVDLQARKALADEGGYQGTADQAAADVDTFVTLPLELGAQAVDIWTWRQPYDGGVASLLGADLAPNPLWTELRDARLAGAELFTHMTPSAMPESRDGQVRECDLVSEVFSAVFVAAGTG